MSTLLFKLNDVSFDEAQDIREILESNDIAFYETDAGRWGFSIAAIWLKDDSKIKLAKQLIDEYQQERRIRIRKEYQEKKEAGEIETVLDRIKNNPVLFFFSLILIVLVLYFSIKPFLQFFD